MIQPGESWADSTCDSWVRRCFAWHHWKIAETQGCSRSLPGPPPAPRKARLNILCYCTASAGQQRALQEPMHEEPSSHPVLAVVAEILLQPFKWNKLGRINLPFWLGYPICSSQITELYTQFLSLSLFFHPSPQLGPENWHIPGDISADALGVCRAFQGR